MIGSTFTGNTASNGGGLANFNLANRFGVVTRGTATANPNDCSGTAMTLEGLVFLLTTGPPPGFRKRCNAPRNALS